MNDEFELAGTGQLLLLRNVWSLMCLSGCCVGVSCCTADNGRKNYRFKKKPNPVGYVGF